MSGALRDHVQTRLDALRGGARRRATLAIAAAALPVAAAFALAARSLGGDGAMLAVAVACALAAILVARGRVRRYDGTWLARRLDAAVPALEDSAALAFEGADAAPLTELQRLQRARVRRRLADAPLPDLRPALPVRVLVGCWLGALVVAALAIWLPLLERTAPAIPGDAPTAGATHVRKATLSIAPPAYTNVDPSDTDSLDAQAPAGSRVAWDVAFDRGVEGAAVVFHDGSRVELRARGERWQGERVLDASALYRIELAGAPALEGDPLHRLDALPDRAPELTVRAPAQTLEVVDARRSTWELAFDATDDYGLGDAVLSIAHAQGSGEQIAVTARDVPLESAGGARSQSYRHTLDLDALGFAEGDDVIARVLVADNREPEPNVTASPSYILRWRPPAEAESAGMEGVVQRVMPAYFRSQRQIIIDTEALIAERARIDDEEYADRADALGVDQKVLRLRYGQFLGEEFEPEGEELPVDEDTNQALLEEYGHAHDLPEAATLFDPVTKGLLRLALAEMWQSELRLRQAQLEDALPYEYKALDYIKEVQQAERIYLARVGVELPQIDAERRLTGEREGLSDRELATTAAAGSGSPVERAWSALARGEDTDLDALQAWVVRHDADAPDTMELLAAVDKARREPACAACRDALAARLWSRVPAPATAVAPRPALGDAEAAYMDALTRAAR
jgi:hypothetical protein